MTFEIINEFEEDGKTYANIELDGLPAICEIINGSLNGECIQYDNDSENRNILKIVNFIDNVLNGLYRIFNSKKIVLQEGYYLNGKLSGEVKHYHSDGILQSTYTYLEGVLNGVNKFYNRRQICTSIKNYINGKLHGEQKLLDSNGVVLCSWNCDNGLLIGDFITYSAFGSILSHYTYCIIDGISVGYNIEKDTVRFQELPIDIDLDMMCSLMFTPTILLETKVITFISNEEFESLNHIITNKKYFISFFKAMETLNVKLKLNYFD